MSSISSPFTEAVSLDESEFYQYGLNKSVDPHPLYPTLGTPLVYFAQMPTRTGRITKHHERKPNLFVRAFRWYTKEHRPPGKMTPFSIKQEHEMDTRQAADSCRNKCEKKEISAFANWLDMKYEQFLLERSEDGNICCDKRTEPSSVICEHVAQNNPCNPEEAKKRFSKFTRCRRQKSKSADRAYCKTNVQQDGLLSISMEYIMAPRSDSPVNSECCQPTPTTTSNPSSNKGLAKSHSVTTCKLNDKLLPPKIDKPPVEEKSYVIKPALDQKSDVIKPTLNEKVNKDQKETKPKKPKRLKQNVSCQCYVRPPNENVKTQFFENIHPCSSIPSANVEENCKDKFYCNVEQYQKLPSKSNVSSQFVRELKLEAQSQYQEPLASKVEVQPKARSKLTRWQVIASRKQKEQAGLNAKDQEVQKSNIWSSFNRPCQSFNQRLPELAAPCPGLNQQCPSLHGPCKPVSRLVSSCSRLRQPSTCQQTFREALNSLKISEADVQQMPPQKASCVPNEEQQEPPLKQLSVQTEPIQLSPIKLSRIQAEPQKQRQQKQQKLSGVQELSSKLKQAHPTFEESCCAPEMYKTDYEAATTPTSKDSLQERMCTTTQIQCPSYKEYKNSEKKYEYGSSKTHNEMNHTCVCGTSIPNRQTVCLLCDCDQCPDSCVTYYDGIFNTNELPYKNVKKLSVAQQTNVTGKCCAECPMFPLKAGYDIISMSQSVDTKPRNNTGNQTSDHSIRLDKETESQNYPLFMKIVRADKQK